MPSLGQGQALGHGRVDLVFAEQLDQRPEVLAEPLRIAGASTNGKRVAASDRKHLVALAQLLDPVGGHAPARREQAPERDGCRRPVQLEPSSPALVAVRDGGGVAEYDEPSAAPQRTEGAKRDPAAERVEAHFGLGHVLERDGKRYLYFDGRTDDWIRKDGENFSALQVARLLQEHPDVVHNLLEGHIAATDFVNENPEESQRVVIDSIEEITGAAVAPETTAIAWKNLE